MGEAISVAEHLYVTLVKNGTLTVICPRASPGEDIVSVLHRLTYLCLYLQCYFGGSSGRYCSTAVFSSFVLASPVMGHWGTWPPWSLHV